MTTPVVEVRLDDGTVLVLDAGTGVRALGHALVEDPPPRIDLSGRAGGEGRGDGGGALLAVILVVGIGIAIWYFTHP